MKHFIILIFIFTNIVFNSFAQTSTSNTPINSITIDDNVEDIRLAGLYMDKAAKRYTTAKVVLASGVLAGVLTSLIRRSDQDGIVYRRPNLLFVGPAGLISLGFGISGDSNLRKGSGILRKIGLKP